MKLHQVAIAFNNVPGAVLIVSRILCKLSLFRCRLGSFELSEFCRTHPIVLVSGLQLNQFAAFFLPFVISNKADAELLTAVHKGQHFLKRDEFHATKL